MVVHDSVNTHITKNLKMVAALGAAGGYKNHREIIACDSNDHTTTLPAE
jgi:hypothetical protein